MKRELQTKNFIGSFTAFVDYQEFIRENPYIEIVSVIAKESSVLVTYYD